MYVWLIRDLEPIPTDPGDRRLMRAGMLAGALAAAGHEVVWFTSSFDHYLKRQRADRDETVTISPNLTVEVLRNPGYRTNISLRRILHNRAFAARWRAFAASAPRKPDVVVTDIPTTESAAAVIEYALENGIPSVLSIRDLWPDLFLGYVKGPLRLLARAALIPLDRQAAFATANATSLIGISPAYLEWGRAKGRRPPTSQDGVFPLAYAVRQRPTSTEIAAYLGSLGCAGRTVISFVGSWGASYDLELVLAAAERLASRTDLVFVVAGNDDARQALRSAFQRLPNVILPGWISGEQIALLISGSAIGLLPYNRSARQGLPNKAFEYMAYGAFQVATLRGELGNFYRETGAGEVIDATADALADAIIAFVGTGGRPRRVALFDDTYAADVVYARMVDHIVQVSQATAHAGRRAPLTDA